MKYLVLLLILIGFVGSAFAMPPFSSQEAYDFSNTIIVGKVIGVNSTFSPTHNLYEIQVEKFLKNPQDSQIILATGEKTIWPRLENQVFNTGDRALFFLTNTTVGYDVYSGILRIHSLSKLVEPEWDACDVFKNNIPQEHWVFGGTGPIPKIHQGTNINPDNFQKGMPVIITYDVSNISNNTQEFSLANSLTFGKSNSHFSIEKSIVLEPCIIYKTFEASFTPRESGNYLFEISDSRTGSFGIGFTIHDSDTDTIESFNDKIFFVSPGYDAGVGANDTILFHGITFTSPAYPELPTPGGSISTKITFDDGTTKRIGFVGPPTIPSLESDDRIKDKPIPIIVENNNAYAGMLHDYDGIHLLVSVDPADLSPLKQFKLGIMINKIQCNSGLVLIQKYDGSPACVTNDTGRKLVERGWATCDYQVKFTRGHPCGISSSSGMSSSSEIIGIDVVKEGKIFDVKYLIKGATIQEMIFSNYTNSLAITIDVSHEGELEVTVPRDLLDARLDYCPPRMENSPDDTFFVLRDGVEIEFDEIKTTSESRTLQITFLDNSTKIEVIGTCFI